MSDKSPIDSLIKKLEALRDENPRTPITNNGIDIAIAVIHQHFAKPGTVTTGALRVNGGATDEPVKETRIRELELFIEQMYETLKAGRIRDFDTNWRMTEKVMPPDLECIHKKDAAEISAAYRKIHLSDILAAARELIGCYWKRDRVIQKREPVDERELQGQLFRWLESGYGSDEIAQRLLRRYTITSIEGEQP